MHRQRQILMQTISTNRNMSVFEVEESRSRRVGHPRSARPMHKQRIRSRSQQQRKRPIAPSQRRIIPHLNSVIRQRHTTLTTQHTRKRDTRGHLDFACLVFCDAAEVDGGSRELCFRLGAALRWWHQTESRALRAWLSRLQRWSLPPRPQQQRERSPEQAQHLLPMLGRRTAQKPLPGEGYHPHRASEQSTHAPATSDPDADHQHQS